MDAATEVKILRHYYQPHSSNNNTCYLVLSFRDQSAQIFQRFDKQQHQRATSAAIRFLRSSAAASDLTKVYSVHQKSRVVWGQQGRAINEDSYVSCQFVFVIIHYKKTHKDYKTFINKIGGNPQEISDNASALFALTTW